MSTKRFSTFEGVFTPCLLSILGVIMYLRLGWVVGQVGLIGAITIIVLANLITLASALSMSSIISNIRIGAGGAYSIITKSLGLEAGGAVGIPLYFCQAISIAFYVSGFTECWLTIYPDHNPLAVALSVWVIVFVVSYVSTKLAFRLQYVIMGCILLSFISVGLGGSSIPVKSIFIQGMGQESFWYVFAVFFPAVTGILAGASMSGELTEPKKSIPQGTIWAIGISFIIYILFAIWFARNASGFELINNVTIIMDLGRFKWMIVVGVMGATLSSALGMFVSSPRVLFALGKHSFVPFSSSFSFINDRGEPTTAILFTALVSLITLLFGTLNQIAMLLTMFFLITYGIINIAVFIEQSIGIVSFRPTFRISRLIPFLGGLSCLCVMFIINAKFSLVALVTIFLIYYFLLKKESHAYSPDVRSGMLVFLAEKFAKAASKLPYYPKIWKPNLLIPISNMKTLSDALPVLEAILAPAGRSTFFKIIDIDVADKQRKELEVQLIEHLNPLKEQGIFVESAVVCARDQVEGTTTVMQTIQGLFFPPNTFFSMIDEDTSKDAEVNAMMQQAVKEGLGVIVALRDPTIGFSQQKIANLWIRRQSPNINLSVLIALQIERNWGGSVRLIQIVYNEDEKQEAIDYLKKLKALIRIPQDVAIEVIVGKFYDALLEAPAADINIFGMQEELGVELVRDIGQKVKTSVLFLRDSKHESALA